MLTEKDYCDYDICVALKELGYLIDWFEDETYHENNTEISLYEAQKWLREEKEVYVTVIPEYNEFGPIKGVKYRLEVAHWKDDEFGYETIEWLDEECPHTIITFDSPEEAFYAYKEAKEAHLKSIAKTLFMQNKITKKVYDALISYKVEISD